jgi:hypothetical protein
MVVWRIAVTPVGRPYDVQNDEATVTCAQASRVSVIGGEIADLV